MSRAGTVQRITDRHAGGVTFGLARRLSLWLPPALYAAAIFAASSSSHPPAPPSLVTDKHVHLIVFAGLALVLLRALSHGWRQLWRPRPAVLAVCLTIAYGIVDEWHQSFVPDRQSDAADLAADGLGAVLAVGFVWLLAAWRHRQAEGRAGRLSAAPEA